MLAAREERRRNRSRINFNEWDGADDGMGGMDEGGEGGGGGKLEDPYDGHLNAEELSRSLLDLVTLYEKAAQAQVGAWGMGLGGGVFCIRGVGGKGGGDNLSWVSWLCVLLCIPCLFLVC